MNDSREPRPLVIPDVLTHAEVFDDHTEHFYYSRYWWSGINVDAALWWKDAAGKCHFRCVLSQNSIDPVPTREVANREIDCGMFRDLLDKLVDIGILDMHSQSKARSTAPCDTILSIRLANGEHNVIRIRGAVPEDKRKWEIADLVMEIAPELFPHTRRKP